MSNGSNLLEEHPSEKKLHTFHPGQDWWLSWIEFWIVLLIGLGIIFAILCLIVWAFSGCFQDIHDKLLPTKTDINDHWRVGLAILIPLFFRPIRTFLEKMKKFGPADTLQDTVKSEKSEQGKGKYEPPKNG